VTDFGLEFINKLKPCKWRYIGTLDDGVEHFGFIAQEVEAIVSHRDYGFVVLGEDQVYGLRLGEFIGPLTKAVQELAGRVASLEEEIRLNAEEKKELYEQHRNACDCKLGHDQAGSHDSVGNRHDLAEDLGNLRPVGEAEAV
jgi:hypothetical protein